MAAVHRRLRAAERAYERELIRITNRINREIAKVVRPYIAEAKRREAARKDADLDLGGFSADFGLVEFRIMGLFQRQDLLPIVDRYGKRIERENRKITQRLVPIRLADEPPEIQIALSEFRRQNVDLIRSIATRQHSDVRRLVTEAAASGMRVETLQKRLLERFDVGKSRAELIARDQTLKANSQFTQIRHREAGILRYTWRASGDTRVREEHADLDGQVFSWDDPPVTNDAGDRNHPGEDYQCRCTAEPVIA